MIEYLFSSAFGKAYAFITSAMTELTFLGICIAGLIVCGASLIFGGHDSDFDGDHDVDLSGHGHDGHDHEQGPGMLSVRGLSLLAVGFGAVGYLAYHYTQKPLFASLTGLASGWLFAFTGLLVLRALLRQQSNALIDTSAIVGSVGIVMVSIPEGGHGEVALTVQGQQLTRVATTQGGAVEHGTPVRILNSAGGVVVVEPVTGAVTRR